MTNKIYVWYDLKMHMNAFKCMHTNTYTYECVIVHFYLNASIQYVVDYIVKKSKLALYL